MLGILHNKYYGWSLLLLGTFYCCSNVATAAIEVSVEAIVKDELANKQSLPLTVVTSQISVPVIPHATATPENEKKPEVNIIKPKSQNSRAETTQKVHALLVSLQGYITEYFAQVESPEQQHIVKMQQQSPNITKEIEKSGQPVEPEIQPATQASAALTHYAQLEDSANQPAPVTQQFVDPQNTSSGQDMMRQDNVMQQLPPQSMPLQQNGNISANSPLEQTLQQNGNAPVNTPLQQTLQQNSNGPANTPLQQTLQKDNTIAPITGTAATPSIPVQQPTANQIPGQQQQPVAPGPIQPASPVQLPPQTGTPQQAPTLQTAPAAAAPTLQTAPAPAAPTLQTAPATNSPPLQMQAPAPTVAPQSEAPANSTVSRVVSTLEQDLNAMDFSKLEAEFKNDLNHASRNPSILQMAENNPAQQPLEILAENSIDHFGQAPIIKTSNHIVPDVKNDHAKVIKNIIALNILIFSILGLIVLLWQKRYSKKITTLLDELRL